MMSDVVIQRCISLGVAWTLNPDGESFEEEVRPELLPLLAAALDDPTPASLINWFEAYATVAGVADEELADASLDLIAQQPALTAEAAAAVSREAAARLALFLEGWPREVEGLDAARSLLNKTPVSKLGTPNMPLDGLPLLAEFVGSDVFTSTRGFPVVKGITTLKDRSGTALAEYTTNTGGGASTYRKTNGPLPPGVYVVSNFRTRDKNGMVKHGTGYSLDVDPVQGTSVFGRSLFRIHPDGLSAGTNGCLGIDGNAETMRQSSLSFRRLAEGGNFLVSVRYSGLG